MNIHKNARLTYVRRLEMVLQMTTGGVTPCAAAAAQGVSATARKWLGRFLAGGESNLRDSSSRPAVSPRSIAPAKALAIIELRRKRLTQARIAAYLGVSKSTVGRVLARAGLSKLSDLEPAEPIVRYEHEAPGDLLHIDIKTLGRIERPSHRVTGNRRVPDWRRALADAQAAQKFRGEAYEEKRRLEMEKTRRALRLRGTMVQKPPPG